MSEKIGSGSLVLWTTSAMAADHCTDIQASSLIFFSFRGFPHTSTLMVFPSSSVPLILSTALVASSSVLKAQQALPGFITSHMSSSQPLSTKCCLSCFHVVFSDRPPTHTFSVLSIALIFAVILDSTLLPGFPFKKEVLRTDFCFLVFSLFSRGSPSFLSFFSFCVHTSTWISLPSKSEPFKVSMANCASSTVLNATQAVPFPMTSNKCGLTVSLKWAKSFPRVTSLSRPPTQTLRSASILPSLSSVSFCLGFLLAFFPPFPFF